MESQKTGIGNAYTLPTIKFARMVGVTEKRLRQLADAGHIPQPINGMWDEENSISGAFAYYRRKKEQVSDGDDAAKKLRAEREIMELKLAKLRGSVAEVTPLEKIWGAIIATTRQKISALPTRLSPNAQFWRNQQDAEAAIRKECDEALECLADPSAYNFNDIVTEDTQEAEEEQ